MIFSKTSILNQTSILCKRKTLSQMKCALQIHHTYLVYFSSHKAHNNSNNNNNNAKCEPQKMYQLQDPRNCHLWLSNKIIFLHSFPYRDICSFKPIFFISFLNSLHPNHLYLPRMLLTSSYLISLLSLPLHPLPKSLISTTPTYHQFHLQCYVLGCSHTSIANICISPTTPNFLIWIPNDNIHIMALVKKSSYRISSLTS